MAAKYQLITELYQRTGAAVSRNPQAWQSFLSSACRNYKCRFDEQLLIFAQRPDATAVTTLETWNRQFKRWVNKDSRGIAVFDTKGRRNTLKYYFDVSDTHEGYYNSRPVPIWQMNERYEQAVIERLSDRFGDLEGNDLGEALMQTAKNAVEDNLPDYLAQLKECTKDSFLEELDDFNVEVIYKRLAVNSVVMFITSKGTMDKASPEVRKYIAQRAELLGAIRLPDNTFRANAGTEVTSDILILQKRDRVIDTEPDWIHLDTDENGVTMNSYFVEHPEMVLGNMVMESTRFGKMDAACKAKKDIPLAELLHEAVQNINGEIPEYEIDEISDEQDEVIPADSSIKNFSYTLVNGKVYFRENDVMTPANLSMTAESRVKGLVEIRDCVRKLIAYQTEDYPEELIRTEQENLNRLYDAYTAKYGLINSRGNYLAFASDESYFLLCSLEVLDDEGNFKRKADMFSKRTIKPHRAVTSVETASEALAISIGEKARVDLPFMAKLTGKEQAELIRDLQGVIFKIPHSEPAKYVTADEYLSGNVRNKLVIAETAAKTDPELIINAEALKKVIPKDLSAGEISVRLGATWIPQEDIQRFVIELLTPSSYTLPLSSLRENTP